MMSLFWEEVILAVVPPDVPLMTLFRWDLVVKRETALTPLSRLDTRPHRPAPGQFTRLHRHPVKSPRHTQKPTVSVDSLFVAAAFTWVQDTVRN